MELTDVIVDGCRIDAADVTQVAAADGGRQPVEHIAVAILRPHIIVHLGISVDRGISVDMGISSVLDISDRRH